MSKAVILAVAAAYVAMSLISATAYALDKRAARKSRRRIRERTLHLLDLVGGWPGACIAQRLFHHKTRDRRFQIWFILTIVLHAAGWGLVIWLRYS